MDKKVTTAQHQLTFITPIMRPNKRCFSAASISTGTDWLHYYLQCLWFFTGRRPSSMSAHLSYWQCLWHIKTQCTATPDYGNSDGCYTTTHCPTEPVKKNNLFIKTKSSYKVDWNHLDNKAVHAQSIRQLEVYCCDLFSSVGRPREVPHRWITDRHLDVATYILTKQGNTG